MHCAFEGVVAIYINNMKGISRKLTKNQSVCRISLVQIYVIKFKTKMLKQAIDNVTVVFIGIEVTVINLFAKFGA